MTKHILVTLPLSGAQKLRLEAAAPGCEFRYDTMEDTQEENLDWANVLIGNAPAGRIRARENLEWFQSNAAGPDAYLKPGVLSPHTVLTTATGAYGLAVSECMLAMWLGILKCLPGYRDAQHRHEWRSLGPMKSVWGSTVLCVGLGDIGESFARRARALGAARVIGVRRSNRACPECCDEVVLFDELDRVLPEADCVALVLPGTPETRHMFDGARIARMKDGAVLLNGGRGSAVDTDALCDALECGKLFGAGLDVADGPEPLGAESRLWDEPNVVLTPHVAGKFSLAETLDRIARIAEHNLKKYCAGETLDNQVGAGTHYVSPDAAGEKIRFED